MNNIIPQGMMEVYYILFFLHSTISFSLFCLKGDDITTELDLDVSSLNALVILVWEAFDR